MSLRIEERVSDAGRLLGGHKKHHHHHGGGGLVKFVAAAAIGTVGYAIGQNAERDRSAERAAAAARRREDERQAKVAQTLNKIAAGKQALNQGDFQRAILEFNGAIGLDPKNREGAQGLLDAHRGRGETLLEQQSYVEAVKHFALATAEDRMVVAANTYVGQLAETVEKADTELESGDPQSIGSALKSYTEVWDQLIAVEKAAGRNFPLEQVALKKEEVGSKVVHCKARLLFYKAEATFAKLKNESMDFPSRATAEQFLKSLKQVEGEYASAAGVDPNCVSENRHKLTEMIGKVSSQVKEMKIQELQEELQGLNRKLARYSFSREEQLEKITQTCNRWWVVSEELSTVNLGPNHEERDRVLDLQQRAVGNKEFLRVLDKTLLNEILSQAIQSDFRQDLILGKEDKEQLEKEYGEVFKIPAIRTLILDLPVGAFKKVEDRFVLYLRSRLNKSFFSFCTNRCNLSKTDPLNQKKVLDWLAEAERKMSRPPAYENPPSYQEFPGVERELSQPMLTDKQDSGGDLC